MAELRVAEERLTVASVREFRAHPDRAAVAAATSAWGLQLPTQANGVSGNAELGCAWIEPNAWLLIAAGARALPEPVPGVLITDVSDRTAAFRVSGQGARDVIAAGCDPALVRHGVGARTRFAGLANAVLQQLGEDDYRLIVDVSIAHAIAAWLALTTPTKGRGNFENRFP